MSYLSNLYSKLSRLKGELTEKENELKSFVKRKREVESIKLRLENACEDNAYPINKFAFDLNTHLKEGLIGSKSVVIVEDAISSELEETCYDEGNIPSGLENLEKELKRIKKIIEDLRREIDSIRWNIQVTYDDIREEERRLEEERRREEERRLEEASKSSKKSSGKKGK